MTRSLLDADFSMLEVVPPSIADDTEIIAMCRSIDPQLREVATSIVEANILPRIADVAEDVLDELAWAFNLSNLQIWDVADVSKKRELLANIFEVRKKSGTLFAVRRTFSLMNLDAEIVEWFAETDLSIPGAGQPYTYRIRILLNPEDGFTRSQWIQIVELTRRFARACAKLIQFAAERDESASLFIYPAPQTGRLVTVGFGG